jgi:hypothetical protein
MERQTGIRLPKSKMNSLVDIGCSGVTCDVIELQPELRQQSFAIQDELTGNRDGR